MHVTHCGIRLVPLLAAAAAIALVAAQCATPWLAGDGVAGTDGPVLATTLWDRDGPGPAPPVLVIGGSFTVVGSVIVNNLAAWDPSTGVWSPLASGVDRAVTALAACPNGDLVVGGNFSYASGVHAPWIARWNAGDRGEGWAGGRERVTLGGIDLGAVQALDQVLTIDEAFTRLRHADPPAADVVRLRFHAGLGEAETAAALQMSERSVRREWASARACLFDALKEQP